MSLPGDAGWISKAMPPIGELCSGKQAHLFTRGLTLCHLDATLRHQVPAQRLLSTNIEADLAARGIDAILHLPEPVGRRSADRTRRSTT